jgi:hypothetical protein
MPKKKRTGKSHSVTHRITTRRLALYSRFYLLIGEHKDAVSRGAPKKRLNKLKRELDETANLLQAMSNDWDM